MRHAILVATISTLGALAPSTEAAVIARESFDYTAGSTSDGSLSGKAPGNGFGASAWTVVGGTNPAAVVANSLSNTPAVYTEGNKASLDLTTNNRLTLSVDTSTGGNFADYLNGSNNIGLDGTTLYISYLLALDDVKGDQGLEFHRDGSRVMLIGGRGTSTSTNLVAATGSATLTTVGTFGGAARNVVRQLVLKIEFLAGNDEISGWLSPNPAALGTPVFADVSVADISFDTLGIFTNANSGGRSTKYDEIRIGETLEDVVSTSEGTFVPEPGSLAIVGLGAMLLGRRRPHRERGVR